MLLRVSVLVVPLCLLVGACGGGSSSPSGGGSSSPTSISPPLSTTPAITSSDPATLPQAQRQALGQTILADYQAEVGFNNQFPSCQQQATSGGQTDEAMVRSCLDKALTPFRTANVAADTEAAKSGIWLLKHTPKGDPCQLDESLYVVAIDRTRQASDQLHTDLATNAGDGSAYQLLGQPVDRDKHGRRS